MRPLFGVAISILASGCTPAFQQPAASEPHALVKVRLLHTERLGPNLERVVLINDHQLELPEVEEQDAPLTTAIRVRPEPTRWTVSAAFFHTSTRTETRQVSEQYACGTQTSGVAPHTFTSTRYCNRMVPRTETVTVRVNDATCKASFGQVPRDAGVYLLQFTFVADEQCTLSCFEQQPAADGTFTNSPCAEAAIAEE
jgi:hypothetical protein